MSKKPPTLTELTALATMIAEFRMWSVKETAERIGCGESTIRRALARYELPAYKVGKNTALDAAEVMAWAKGQPYIPNQPNPITLSAAA